MEDAGGSAIDGDLFRAIFEHSQDGIAIADARARYLAVNPTFCRMLGYSEQELLNLSILDVVAPAELEQHPLEISELTKGLPVVTIRELIRKDGRTFSAEISAFPLPDGRIVGLHRDATERVNAEKRLREQRDLGLRLAASKSLDGTLRTCLRFAIVSSGMEGGAIFLAPAPDADFELACHKGVESPPRGMPVRLSRRSSPGREIALGKPLYGKHDALTGAGGDGGPSALALIPFSYQGEVMGCLAMVSHQLEVPPPSAQSTLEAISAQLAQAIARARAEADLMEQRALLEREVAARTQELRELNQRLREVIAGHEETLAERARLIAQLEGKNTELERFVYTVSHDLRSPVITIKGFAGLVAEDLEEGSLENVRSDLERISGAATQMQRLLDSLVELSRIGRRREPVEPIDMTRLARDAVAALADRVQSTGARVQIDALPGAFGERRRIRDVFENLVRNALAFPAEGIAPEIHIGATREGNTIIYFVRDNGRGIEAKHHQRVFDMFVKLQTSGEGTGIGLTIARKVVEVHDGRIWIESSGSGQGTTVKFTLSAQP